MPPIIDWRQHRYRGRPRRIAAHRPTATSRRARPRWRRSLRVGGGVLITAQIAASLRAYIAVTLRLRIFTPAPTVVQKFELSRSCGVLLALARRRRRREMIEFLAQMPTDTMIFLTMAVLSLAATLIVLTAPLIVSRRSRGPAPPGGT